jgi:hypothetical protein
VDLGADVRGLAVARLDGVYQVGGVDAGQGLSGVTWWIRDGVEVARCDLAAARRFFTRYYSSGL